MSAGQCGARTTDTRQVAPRILLSSRITLLRARNKCTAFLRLPTFRITRVQTTPKFEVTLINTTAP